MVGYLTMMSGFVGLAYTRNLFSISPFVLALQAGAVALITWARVTFGRRSYHVAANPTRGGLVTTGPYRFIRHPIYTAVCLFIVPGVIAHWSWTAVLLGALVVGSSLLRMLLEERLLITMYPEYRAYAAAHARMIPFVF